MSNLTLAIWFDPQAEIEADFAKFFSADIQKCLLRYLPNYSVEVLHNAKGEYGNLYVQSSGSANGSMEIISESKSMIVQIEPVQGTHTPCEQYLFWDKHYETDEVRLYRRADKDTKNKYWEKLTDIAIAIRNDVEGNNQMSGKPKVYLSLDDNQNSADRENLKRDLSDLGYQVIPNRQFSSNFSECTQQIDDALRDVDVIIHIIPPIYNIHFPESHLSLTEHQCNRSAKLMEQQNGAPLRIIWISSAYEISDEENQIFIEKIQRDQSQTQGSVVLKSSIEDLKKYYRQKVAPSVSSASEPDEGVDVYVVADDSSDEEKVVENLGGGRVSASFHVDRLSYTQHLRLLSKASSVVVCYTSSNPQWLAVKANDVLKSKGVDRAKRFEKVVLYRHHKDLEVETPASVFTDVVDSLTDLKKIFNQSSNK